MRPVASAGFTSECTPRTSFATARNILKLDPRFQIRCRASMRQLPTSLKQPAVPPDACNSRWMLAGGVLLTGARLFADVHSLRPIASVSYLGGLLVGPHDFSVICFLRCITVICRQDAGSIRQPSSCPAVCGLPTGKRRERLHEVMHVCTLHLVTICPQLMVSARDRQGVVCRAMGRISGEACLGPKLHAGPAPRCDVRACLQDRNDKSAICDCAVASGAFFLT